MPTYVLLDGTTALVDFNVALISTGTANNSIKCVANYISLMLRRGTNQKLTFCSGGWAQPSPTVKQGFGHIDGFVSTGGPLSDPLALFSQDLPLPFIFTAHTGCTFTGSLIETQDMSSMRAMADSGRGIDFETYGPVTTVWVIA